jgi:carboxyl-terminal processing protease
MKLSRSALAVAVTVALAACLAGPAARVSAAANADDDLSKQIQAVASAYDLVERNFADPVSSEKAFFRGAIPGMLQTLDPHSSFVDPAEYREMMRQQRAQYFGVGMQISMDKGHTIVLEPFPDSPAAKADLRRGDTISAIDGKDVLTLDSTKVAELLRGPRGTQVTVSVKREGVEQPVSVVVTRGEITTSVVDAFWLQDGILLLRVSSFQAQNVSKDVEDYLKRVGEANVKGLLLDLRGNGGGLVSEAVNLAGRFLRSNQVVVSHRGRAEREQVFRAKANTLAQKYPIIVLVDRGSASASEIVTGALQDHDRAWVFGDTTFGKGLVQAQFPLSEGAALLLTIAHYYTPSGRLIQRDYHQQSFFDYLYTRHADTQNPQDVKATDSGRKVFGGGGVTPDEKYASPTATLLQRRLANTLIFYRFANSYFEGRKPQLPQGWTPDAATIERFRESLKSQQIAFRDSDIDANRDWLRDQIRYEFYLRAFSKKDADRAILRDDPEVKKAVESLPRAEALVQQADRLVAERTTRGK